MTSTSPLMPFQKMDNPSRLRRRIRIVELRSRVPASSPGLLGGNPPPRWGAPGDDPAGSNRAGKRGP
jgi:hypothetical protein